MPLIYKDNKWSPVEFRRPFDKTSYNVLMIGNSFCYYFVEELAGMAKAVGIDLTIYNLYKGGCTINEHYDSYINGTALYEVYKTDSNGRTRVNPGTLWNIKYSITQPELVWDKISLQQHFGVKQLGKPGWTYEETNKDYIKELYNYLNNNYPKAELYWQETWSYEIGHDQGPKTLMEQREDQATIKKISHEVVDYCKDLNVKYIPSGDTWEIARRNPWLKDEMCIRTSVGNDYYHDGDIGGGQYLNACVWLENVFNASCIDNTWRPSNYSLIENKIAAAQKIAHAI